MWFVIKSYKSWFAMAHHINLMNLNFSTDSQFI